MLVTRLVTNIQILSPTHLVSNVRHQHRCNRQSLLVYACLCQSILVNVGPWWPDGLTQATVANQVLNGSRVEVQRTNTHRNNIILLIIIVFRIRGIGGNSADRFSGRKGRKSSSQLKRK